MASLRIPRQWEDVTPEWMTRAIASRHPDARVGAVELVTRDDGTNRRARFGIRYASGSGPETVFLKAHAAKHRIVHLRNGNLFNEARLFSSGTLLPVEHPIVYSSVVDWLRLDFLLVMEDLCGRGADPRDATRPLTPAQGANGLQGLAKVHRRYWGFSGRSHPALRWVKTWKPSKGWQVGLRKRTPLGLARGLGQLPPEITPYSGDQIVDFWARYVALLSAGPVTLLHGDAHVGNTYVLPGGEVGFLDWQVTRRGHWSQDVGYFLAGALTVEDRRRQERGLVETYRQALALPQGQEPGAEEAWLWYRASPAYGLAVWLSTLGTDSYQSSEISLALALAQRYAAALIELDTRSALAELEARRR